MYHKKLKSKILSILTSGLMATAISFGVVDLPALLSANPVYATEDETPYYIDKITDLTDKDLLYETNPETYIITGTDASSMNYVNIKLIDRITDGKNVYDTEGTLRDSEEQLVTDKIIPGTNYCFKESAFLANNGLHANTDVIRGIAGDQDITIIFTYQCDSTTYDEWRRVLSQYNGSGSRIVEPYLIPGYIIKAYDINENPISNVCCTGSKRDTEDRSSVQYTLTTNSQGYAICEPNYYAPFSISMDIVYGNQGSETDYYGNKYGTLVYDFYGYSSLTIKNSNDVVIGNISAIDSLMPYFVTDSVYPTEQWFTISSNSNVAITISNNWSYDYYRNQDWYNQEDESNGYYNNMFEINIIISTDTQAFITRLYEKCLGRSPEASGLRDWDSILTNKELSGAQVAYGFVFSQEYKNKNTTNDEFVEMLYEVFMDRPSDPAGKAAWVSALEQGASREKVFSGFAQSQEFTTICNSYGIDRGTVELSQPRDVNMGVTGFCARMYTQALGRNFDEDGLNAWCSVILDGSGTPEQVAENFINSQEFINKNLNNEEYVKVLYRTFMGREYDQSGLDAWVSALNSGTSRLDVLHGFSRSPEFSAIMAQYGL